MDKPVASLDRASALKRLDGDAEFYRVLVGVFLEDAPVQIQKLAEAMRIADANTAIGVAHTLKSGGRTVGAMIFGDLCAELENCLAMDDPKSAGFVFAKLLAEYKQIAWLLEGDVDC